MCPSLLQPYNLTNSMSVCSPTTDIDKGKEICSGFSEMPTYWWETTISKMHSRAATEACQESLESSTTSHPHGTAHRCCASSFICSRPQVIAVDSKLSYCDSASSVSRDSQPCELSPAPCPACLVLGLLQRRAPAPAGRRHPPGSPLLSLASVPWLCFPASR